MTSRALTDDRLSGGHDEARRAASFGEDLMIAWPQTVALIASTIVLFVARNIVFQRREVRA